MFTESQNRNVNVNLDPLETKSIEHLLNKIKWPDLINKEHLKVLDSESINQILRAALMNIMEDGSLYLDELEQVILELTCKFISLELDRKNLKSHEDTLENHKRILISNKGVPDHLHQELNLCQKELEKKKISLYSELKLKVSIEKDLKAAQESDFEIPIYSTYWDEQQHFGPRKNDLMRINNFLAKPPSVHFSFYSKDVPIFKTIRGSVNRCSPGGGYWHKISESEYSSQASYSSPNDRPGSAYFICVAKKRFTVQGRMEIDFQKKRLSENLRNLDEIESAISGNKKRKLEIEQLINQALLKTEEASRQISFLKNIILSINTRISVLEGEITEEIPRKKYMDEDIQEMGFYERVDILYNIYQLMGFNDDIGIDNFLKRYKDLTDVSAIYEKTSKNPRMSKFSIFSELKSDFERGCSISLKETTVEPDFKENSLLHAIFSRFRGESSFNYDKKEPLKLNPEKRDMSKLKNPK